MKKTMAFLTALVMTALSMPLSSVSAVSAYAQGDVDMDGLITGRDAAMVSMYADGMLTLTEEQQALADVNADGTADDSDAALIYENQEYPLGDTDLDGYIEIAGGTMAVAIYEGRETAGEYSHLADVNCDGVIDLKDVSVILNLYSLNGNGLPHFTDGKYYYTGTLEGIYLNGKFPFGNGDSYMTEYPLAIRDLDGDLYITGRDTQLLEKYVNGEGDLTETQRKDADVNQDGTIDAEDVDTLHRYEYFELADANMDGTVSVSDATYALESYAQRGAGLVRAAVQDADTLRADVNCDGVVDLSDATQILTAYARRGAGLE
ncbi:MAG: hypothetical protein IJ496_04635 [Ruminococcus sp.]|nr:hypothetical protein [Ruminococcus sp.]